ncbi:MAG: phosphatase PAP2 family protein [Bacillota bacterium]
MKSRTYRTFSTMISIIIGVTCLLAVALTAAAAASAEVLPACPPARASEQPALAQQPALTQHSGEADRARHPVETDEVPAAEDCAYLAYSPGISGKALLFEDIGRIYTGRIDVDPGKASLLLIAGGAILLVDQDLYNQVSAGPRTPEAEQWGETITNLGSGVATLGISGLIALRDPKTGYLAANAVIYSGISCAVLKAIFGRARPEAGEGPYAFSGPGVREGYNSMPSGHSAAAFALATVLARQYPKYKVLFYTGATLVAVSRVYVSAHWPSDTLIGAAIGVWSANQVMGRSRLFEVRW